MDDDRCFWKPCACEKEIVCASRIPPTTWLIRAKVNSFVSFIRVEHSRKVSRLADQLTEKMYRT